MHTEDSIDDNQGIDSHSTYRSRPMIRIIKHLPSVLARDLSQGIMENLQGLFGSTEEREKQDFTVEIRRLAVCTSSQYPLI